MPINILFVLLSFVIGIFATNYIRSFDIHEKEPLPKMILVVLWGGAWSVVLAILTYGLLKKAGMGKIDNFLGAVFVIGPVEEAAKFLALLSSYFFNDIYHRILSCNDKVRVQICPACSRISIPHNSLRTCVRFGERVH